MAVDRESVEEAKAAALRFLEARMHTRREVRDRLTRRGFAPAAVARALDDLERVGLIDDAAYARTFIENRLRTRPKGYALLKAEIVRKGIAPPVAADAVRAAREARPEIEVARDLLAKAAARFAALAPEARRRRRASFLKSRGFATETIAALLHEAWDGI
jgi:regulatory protein